MTICEAIATAAEQQPLQDRSLEPFTTEADQVSDSVETTPTLHPADSELKPAVRETRPRRKIIVCCDSTWNSEYKEQPVTNVVRFARCVMPADGDGVPQILLYQPGVGTGTSRIGNIVEGATGRGLYENILGAYNFICHNYNTVEDEIHLIGFSRGAFTVRSVAQLLNDIGLLSKKGLGHLQPLFKLWKNGHLDQVSQEVEKLVATNQSRRNIRVKTCAVWDTVCSLGLPMIGILPQPAPRKLKFVNSDLCPNIDNAIQALSLHEHRRHFQAIVWKKPDGTCQTLKQCWFLGFHSDVGGGNKDKALAHLAMVWMIDQMSGYLNLQIDNLWGNLQEEKVTDFTAQHEAANSWSVGMDLSISFGASISVGYTRVLKGLNLKIKESMRGVFIFGGSKTRRPCQYFWEQHGVKQVDNANADAGQEEVHFSVRALLADRCFAPCAALNNAEVKVDGGKAIWTMKPKKSGTCYDVPEAKASPQEISLLGKWIRTQATSCDKMPHDHKQASLLTVFWNMLSEGTTPTKPWSATAYRKETTWTKVLTAEASVGAAKIGASWSTDMPERNR